MGDGNSFDIGGVDIREVSACTGLRLRRTARSVTRIYDEALAGAGLTINQFGLLAQLYGWHLQNERDPSIGQLAERLGLDATTLNRALKPLIAEGLVEAGRDADDHRVRTTCLTDAGRSRLGRATKAWQGAQASISDGLGHEATLALNALLDLAVTRLQR